MQNNVPNLVLFYIRCHDLCLIEKIIGNISLVQNDTEGYIQTVYNEITHLIPYKEQIAKHN